jgi:hypothetical protein
VRPVRPTLEEIQHYLVGAPFASWTDQARRFATSETLEPKSHKSYLRTLLYPGRFCYSWMTGMQCSEPGFSNPTGSLTTFAAIGSLPECLGGFDESVYLQDWNATSVAP